MFVHSNVKPSGFSVIELVVVAGLLGLFFTFIYHVFIGGVARTSEHAQWAGSIVNQLRGLSAHVGIRAKTTGRPMTLLPASLHENTSEDFQCRIWGQPVLCATEAIDVSGTAKPGTIFVRFVEAEPERQGGTDARPAKLTYHLYSLTKSGNLLYHSFTESVGPTAPPEYIATLRRPMIPPQEAIPGRAEILVGDVESVAIERPAESRQNSVGKGGIETRWPLTLIITCHNPRGQTRRTERITFVPNVPVR